MQAYHILSEIQKSVLSCGISVENIVVTTKPIKEKKNPHKPHWHSKPQWMSNGQSVGGLTVYYVDAFITWCHITGWHSAPFIQITRKNPRMNIIESPSLFFPKTVKITKFYKIFTG